MLYWRNKMKKKWIALIIMVASLCFACACDTNKDNSSNNSANQDVSSNENESGINGGSMEGDNDLDWNNPQN